MKLRTFRFFAFACLTLFTLTGLFGCGSSDSTSSTATVAGSCSSGYVYSANYGCLAQCGNGYGYYNGQCISVYATSTAGTCASGYVYSAVYGCLASCGVSGYGLYNGQCINVSTTTTTISSCQATCLTGYVRTMYGCLPQSNYCGTCAGTYGPYCIPGY